MSTTIETMTDAEILAGLARTVTEEDLADRGPDGLAGLRRLCAPGDPHMVAWATGYDLRGARLRAMAPAAAARAVELIAAWEDAAYAADVRRGCPLGRREWAAAQEQVTDMRRAAVRCRRRARQAV